MHLIERPRRLRRTEGIRRMATEARLSTDNLVMPLFMKEGEGVREAIPSMPDQYRLSVDLLVEEAKECYELGIPAVALFPAVDDEKKDKTASHALDPDSLFPRATKAIKEAVPELLVITDVALDPYNSDGHDGIVRDGEIDNDATLEVIEQMAVLQARAGADIIAPSDMMDGRVSAIRSALDSEGYTGTGILSYTAKYASAFYGPFRDALDSAPRELEGVPADKSTYQMNPANRREALREMRLDEEEGADLLMVKPALPYLDVIRLLRDHSTLPIAAYHVSGEYAMIKAAAQNGWLDEAAASREAVLSIRRAGADVIFTYFAKDLAAWLNG